MSGTFALTALKHVREKRKIQSGEMVDCIVIPLQPNHLKLTEKGNVYVNFSAWPRKTVSQIEGDKSTHLINHDPGKEIRDMLKTAGQYPATLGNLTVWDQVQSTPQTGEQAPASMGEIDPTADLPF